VQFTRKLSFHTGYSKYPPELSLAYRDWRFSRWSRLVGLLRRAAARHQALA